MLKPVWSQGGEKWTFRLAITIFRSKLLDKLLILTSLDEAVPKPQLLETVTIPLSI